MFESAHGCPLCRLLLHLFEITGLPAPVERRLFRPINADIRKPTFAGLGLDPSVRLPGRSARAEVEIDRGRTRDILQLEQRAQRCLVLIGLYLRARRRVIDGHRPEQRSEEHTSELQSRENLVCRLLLEKKKKTR